MVLCGVVKIYRGRRVPEGAVVFLNEESTGGLFYRYDEESEKVMVTTNGKIWVTSAFATLHEIGEQGEWI